MELALALAINLTTVYRWEQDAMVISGLHLAVLQAVADLMKTRKTREARYELGQRLKSGIPKLIAQALSD